MAVIKLDNHTLKILRELQNGLTVAPFMAHFSNEFTKANEAVIRSISPIAADLLDSQRKLEAVISPAASLLAAEAMAFNEHATRHLNGLISTQLADCVTQQSDLLKLYNHTVGIDSKIAASLLETQQRMSKLLPGIAIPEFQNYGVFGDLVSRYCELVEESDPEPFETLTNEVIRESEGKINSDAFVAYVYPFLLSLLFLVIGQLLNASSEEHLDERFGVLEEQGKIITSKLYAITNSETFYYVKRAVHLRDGPSTKDQVLLTIPPGNTVRLLNRYSKWIEVEHYDYLNDTTTTGWVYKKYLKMIRR